MYCSWLVAERGVLLSATVATREVISYLRLRCATTIRTPSEEVMAATPVTLADLTSALSEIRHEIPRLVQPLVISSISPARVEISAELQSPLTDLNDCVLKQIELQASAIKLRAEAQQIEIA